ncbi:hypothetical protein Afil01_23380 [Actinorhabdospora filicis]|uniref:Carrier domain-containing protein n=1 Tax=Actinorhabdospora filicis TaxID=1785913 RepID=A0A9W6SMY1_9ACTN|nr:non-ribosomal peptide synthetase [Actinorhabdospora filicis]GLZ77531.1 hypothetical protein Afil01_23380 [Actinorhabdospora filicis]
MTSTLAGLRARISARTEAFPTRAPGDPAPLSFGQERMRLLNQMAAGSPVGNMSYAYRISGALDVDALSRAVSALGRRHAILRTLHTAGDQVILPDPVPLTVLDAPADLDGYIATAVDEPFDLAAEPPVRWTLLRRDAGEHVLLLRLHHIATDGWSESLLHGELARLYAGAALPELRVQYADYAAWQRSRDHDADAARWREVLAGAPGATVLPFDRSPAVTSDHKGRTARSRLPKDLTAAVHAYAQASGASDFMVCLAAFTALLTRYDDRGDLVIGTPVAGRSRPELEDLVGFFVNTVPLRVDASGDPSFADLVGRVKESTLDGLERAETPIERVVAEVKPVREPGRQPLTQVFFQVHNTPAEPLSLPGLRVSQEQIFPSASNLDLSVTLLEGPEGFEGYWEYRTDLFDAATIERLQSQYARLLAAYLAAPESAIGDAEGLAEGELELLLRGWNDTAAAFEPGHVTDLFAATVAAFPDAIAVRDGERELSYAELDAWASRLAHRLIAEGAGPGRLVGVLSGRSAEQIAAVLGVLKSGAAYLPLDPDAPVARLADLVADVEPVAVLIGPGVPEPVGNAIPVEDFADFPESDPGVRVDGEEIAYVIFTSGSTGKPKGAAITHAGLANYLKWMVAAYPADAPGDAVFHSRLTFDFTVTPLFWPLLTGRAVRIVAGADVLDGLARVLRDTSVPIGLLKLTPAHLEALSARFEGEPLTTVGNLVVGGEQFHGATADAWQRLFPGARIVNEYGPTETVVGCVVRTFSPADDPAQPVPIGLPIAETAVYVLDAAMRPVPIGGLGELYIGGAGVSRGYLGRPALTGAAFVPDPFGGVPGARMYRTGDLVRRRADGVIEYLGRRDGQIKLRGHRIELGEVEAALRALPGVEQAAVIVREDRPGLPRLVGYHVPELPTGELLGALRKVLPPYMVPSALVGLDALPMTRNGKVDRAALPAPSAEADGHVPPATPTEIAVAGVWGELLGVRVGATDDFFGSGGHSLVAARASSQLRNLLGLRTEQLLRTLFARPVLADFAAEVDALLSRDGETVPGIESAPATDRSQPFELSRGQERVWFLDQLDASGGEYEMPLALRLTGPLDVDALRAALTGIVERHDVLRTSVRIVDDRPMGVLRPVGDFALEILDEHDPSKSGGDIADIAELAEKHTRERLDLDGGLPIRARLLRLAEDDHLLCLTFHHMSFDGWSYHVFYEELAAGYAGAAIEPPPVAFHDLAVWQESRVDPAGMEFWRSTLDGLAPFEPPADKPRPARRRGLAHSTTVTVPPSVADALERLGTEHRATLFMVLLSACQVLFHRHSGRADVTIGTTAAERTHADSERVIGLFVNMLVLRGDLSGNPTFGALLDRTRDMAVAAYAHQDTPFDRLVEELAPERDLSRTPLFGVMVKLNSQPESHLTIPGLGLAEVPVALAATKYDVAVDFERTPEGLRCLVVGDADLYEASTVDRWARHLAVLLADLAARPTVAIGEAALLTPAEAARERLLTGPEPSEFPAIGLHELFERQAAQTPGAEAVVDVHGSLTYAELDDRAARVAGALRGHGVGPDVPVAVMLHRSGELLAGVLGVLKAGGAFVPVETDTPVARVRALLEGAGCPVALVEPELADTVREAGGTPLTIAEAVLAAPVAKVDVHPDNLCAVYFTSGSTGKPKGVACTHGGWVNRMWWMQNRHGMRPGETVLHKTTLTFDDSAVELFWPLLAGGRVAMLAPGQHRDPAAILDAAVKYRSVHINFVPSMLDLFLSTLDERGTAGLESLRSVLSSGEALRPALVARFLERFGTAVSLDNTWGATEVSIDSTWRECGPADAAGDAVVSLGVAFDNNDVCVLDQDFAPLPVGVPGELAIGGVGLARCYLGDPRKTAAAFVPHPYRPGERIYRTGDQGRAAGDGSLTFMDRRDNQVKIRGVRIELGEVETVLRAHPGVAEAAVIAWQATPSDKRLAAYVVVSDPSVTAADLRAHAQAHLAGYAVPGSIALIGALPLLASGKLDRKALPSPDPESVRERPYRAPSTPGEEVIAGLWAQVLGLSQVGADDDFFAVGGHSLLATRIITRMRQAFGLDLPLSLVFEKPTVAEAAAAVEELILAELAELSEEDALLLAGEVPA